jgi:hypothetical protein
VPTQKGRYQLRFSAVAPLNPGPTAQKIVSLRHG